MFKKFLATYSIYEPVLKTKQITETGPVQTSDNPAKSPSTTTTNSGGYVSYIQYTLSSSQIPVKITGVYDAATAAAVRKFQSDKKLNLVDAIVDSETKSVLALFWLDLYKYDRSKYTTLFNKAPDQAKKFIQAAILYSNIENAYDGSDSTEYRRISYTGVPGPTTVVDHIVFEVPEVLTQDEQPMPWQEILGIIVQAGAWPLGIKKVWMYEQDLGLGGHVVPEFNDNSIKALPANTFAMEKMLAPNEKFEIKVPTNRKIKYVMIEVYGNSLTQQDRSVYGPNAEGFSIKDVSFSIKTPIKGKEAIPATTKAGKVIFKAVGSGVISGETNITSGDFGVFKLASISDANAYPGSSINQVILNSLLIEANIQDDAGKDILGADGKPAKVSFTHNLSNPIIYPNSSGGFNNNEISFTYDGIKYDIEALTETTGLSGLSPSITSVNRSGGPTGVVSLTTSEINSQFSILNNMAPIYQVVTTNGVEIESKEYSEEYSVSDFYVADADSSGLKYKQNTKLSINAKDGVVVLTNADGNPIRNTGLLQIYSTTRHINGHKCRSFFW